MTAGAQAGVRLSGLRPSLRLAGGGVRSVVTTPVFTSGAPVAGTAGVEYAFTVTAEGLGSITFAVTSGSLPAGLSLDASSGKISGIPTTPGTATFTITASSPLGSATQEETITIAGAAPVFLSRLAPVGTVGVGYTFTVSASGTAPIAFAVAPGSLPAGLSLDASSGKISGIPTTPGTTTFTITASNPYGSAAQQEIITVVSATAPVLTSGAPAAGTAGVGYAFAVSASGAPPITFAVTSGSLPAGLSLDASSGKISGIPTTPGTTTFTITASNPFGSATQKDTITIASAAPAPAAAAPPAVAKRAGAVLAGDLARTGSEAASSLTLGGCGALSLLVVGAMMMITRRQPLGGR